jgi:hypothetical protein
VNPGDESFLCLSTFRVEAGNAQKGQGFEAGLEKVRSSIQQATKSFTTQDFYLFWSMKGKACEKRNHAVRSCPRILDAASPGAEKRPFVKYSVLPYRGSL